MGGRLDTTPLLPRESRNAVRYLEGRASIVPSVEKVREEYILEACKCLIW